jgi:hypothetical protein
VISAPRQVKPLMGLLREYQMNIVKTVISYDVEDIELNKGVDTMTVTLTLQRVLDE